MSSIEGGFDRHSLYYTKCRAICLYIIIFFYYYILGDELDQRVGQISDQNQSIIDSARECVEQCDNFQHDNKQILNDISIVRGVTQVRNNLIDIFYSDLVWRLQLMII